MRTTLTTLLSIACALTLRAQTNITFTKIKVIPDPVKSNFNQITLNITNINPNQTYAMLFARRLVSPVQDSFAFYIPFSSPSNSTTIVRQTTNSILIRFYEVASTNIFGPQVANIDWSTDVSEYDDHDLPCEECDQEEQAMAVMESVHSFLQSFGLWEPAQVPDDILEIIMPPGLKPSQRK